MHAPSLEFFSFVILGGLLGSGSGGTVIRESATPGDGDVTVRRKNDARDVVGRDRIRRSRHRQRSTGDRGTRRRVRRAAHDLMGRHGAARIRESDGPDEEKRRQFRDEAVVHRELLYRRGLHLTAGDEAWAEDLVQETMLKAYRAWDRFETGTNCRAWLMTILRHTFLNERRRRKRRPVALDYGEAERRPGSSEMSAWDSERALLGGGVDEEVGEAVEALDEAFRTPLLLRELAELTYDEIADRLDLPLGTVKSRLFRARRQLRGLLEDYARRVGALSPDEGSWESGRTPSEEGPDRGRRGNT